MTLEQEIDYKALSLISKNNTYSNSDLVTLFSNILTTSKAAELHKKFVENEYYKQAVSGIPDYVLHDRALFYLDFLNKEKDKDEIDIKLKRITISNSKFQKWTPIVSAFIAMLSIIATIFIARTKTEKPYIPVQEIQQLQKTQEQINKSIKQYLDTLRVHQKQ
ncbi:hypothetical protein [Ferruginibacter sp.]|nr:hypothetical protein [Ferruginibacter sp.]